MGRTCAISGLHLRRGEECLTRYLSYEPKPKEPSRAGARMRLGMIYEKLGDKSKAKIYYQDALQKDPNMKEAKKGLERVK